jgi:hypothetical protein
VTQQRILIILCAFAVSLLGTGSTTTAYAASALPEFSVATASTDTGVETAISAGPISIRCKTDVGKFGAGTKLGTFVIDFKECTSLAQPCTGLAQTSGLIEVTGEWHLVSSLTNRKSYAIWFLFASSDGATAVHVECSGAEGTLTLIWGNVLALIEEKSERTFKINTETEGSGPTLKQKITEFGNNNGEIVKSSLKGRTDGGPEVPIVGLLREDLLFTEKFTKLRET